IPFEVSRYASIGNSTSSSSFGGSLNISRSLTALNSITAGSFNTLGSIFVGGLAQLTNASASNAFEVGTNAFVIRSAGTSSSLAFETTSYASASNYFGAGLTSCNSALTSKLLWSNGIFSCGTDTDTAGGAISSIRVKEILPGSSAI